MNGIKLWLFVAVVFCLSSTPSLALCNSFTHDKTPGALEFTYICENSYSNPRYKIVQHYFGEDVIGILSFAPFEQNILCNDYEMGREKRQMCRSYGARPLKKSYDAKPNDSFLYELGRTKDKILSNLYEDDPIFAYPQEAAAVDVEGCFALIDDDKKLHIGYREDDFLPLTQCLINLELYITKNRKSVLGY